MAEEQQSTSFVGRAASFVADMGMGMIPGVTSFREFRQGHILSGITWGAVDAIGAVTMIVPFGGEAVEGAIAAAKAARGVGVLAKTAEAAAGGERVVAGVVEGATSAATTAATTATTAATTTTAATATAATAARTTATTAGKDAAATAAREVPTHAQEVTQQQISQLPQARDIRGGTTSPAAGEAAPAAPRAAGETPPRPARDLGDAPQRQSSREAPQRLEEQQQHTSTGGGGTTIPKVPRDIVRRQINKGIRELVEAVNKGEYETLRLAKPEEYKKMMTQLSDRISKFKLSDANVVNEGTIEGILKNPFLASRVSEVELQKLLSRGLASKPDFVARLMEVPEIAATRLETILENGRAVPSLQAGKLVAREMSAAERQNILNRIDMAQYDANHRTAGLLAADGVDAASGPIQKFVNWASKGITTVPHKLNDGLSWRWASAGKALYAAVVGAPVVWALGAGADKISWMPISPAVIAKALANNDDGFSQAILKGITTLWSDNQNVIAMVRAEKQKSVGEGQRGDFQPTPVEGRPPSSNTDPATTAADQQQRSCYQKLKTAYPDKPENEIKQRAAKVCQTIYGTVRPNGPSN